MQKELDCLLAFECNPYQQVDLPKRHRRQLYRWPELSSSGFGRGKVWEWHRQVVVVPGSDMVVVVFSINGVSSSNSAGQEIAHVSNG